MAEPRQLEQVEAFFRGFCRRRGLKMTQERRQILEAVATAGEHFDSEWLFDRMRQQRSRVSRATLYRTIALLRDAGILKQVLHGHKHMHYEYVFGRQEHDHIVDVDTGQVVEVDSAEMIRLRDAICRRLGYRALSHRLQIFAVREVLPAGDGQEGEAGGAP